MFFGSKPFPWLNIPYVYIYIYIYKFAYIICIHPYIHYITLYSIPFHSIKIITLHQKYMCIYIYDPVSRVRRVHGSRYMVWGATTPTAPTPEHINRGGHIDIHRYKYICKLYIYIYIQIYICIHILHTYMRTHVIYIEIYLIEI